jgi:hypothetical protein
MLDNAHNDAAKSPAASPMPIYSPECVYEIQSLTLIACLAMGCSLFTFRIFDHTSFAGFDEIEALLETLLLAIVA